MVALVLLVGSGYWTFLPNHEGLTGGDPVTQLSSLGYTRFDPVLLAITVLLATAFRGGVTGSWIDIGWMPDFGLIAWAAATPPDRCCTDRKQPAAPARSRETIDRGLPIYFPPAQAVATMRLPRRCRRWLVQRSHRRRPFRFPTARP